MRRIPHDRVHGQLAFEQRLVGKALNDLARGDTLFGDVARSSNSNSVPET
jgi:hypothetical protein